MKRLLQGWNKISLVQQIIIGLVIGIILSLSLPNQVSGIAVLGDLFVGATKSRSADIGILSGNGSNFSA